MKNRIFHFRCFQWLVILFIFNTIICSCEMNEEIIKPVERKWENGVFIVNEGGFNHTNASLGWYDFTTKSYRQELFKNANGYELGDVFQSINFSNNKMLLAVNNSDKIEVIDAESLKQESNITAVSSPRHLIVTRDEKLYISSLKETSVTVWDLKSNAILKKISFPGWSENMLVHNDLLFVSNPSFYSGKPTNHIYIISLISDRIVDSIEVLTSPGEMILDANNDLWVYCQGHFLSKLNGGLVKVDLKSRKMIRAFKFDEPNNGFTTSLSKTFSGDTLLFLRNNVFKMSIEAQDLPSVPVITAKGRTLYALGSDKDNRIWVGDAVDYVQKGVVSIYSSSGVLDKEFRVGVIPSRFYFR